MYLISFRLSPVYSNDGFTAPRCLRNCLEVCGSPFPYLPSEIIMVPILHRCVREARVGAWKVLRKAAGTEEMFAFIITPLKGSADSNLYLLKVDLISC